jgi:hypothetical protein
VEGPGDPAAWAWHGRLGVDLALVYYGSDEAVAARFRAHAQYFFRDAGPKWQLTRKALGQIPWRERYEYVWLPDDDLDMRGELLPEMFALASRFGVLLGHPALDGGSVAHEVLRRQPCLTLRFTNFVEIMAPFFRVDALDLVLPTMDTPERKAGHGMDFTWPPISTSRTWPY